MARASAATDLSAPFARQFAENLAKVATSPADQFKAQKEAFLASPQWAEAQKVHERIQSGEDIFADVSDEELTDTAAKLNLTPQQFRSRMKQLTEKTRRVDWNAHTTVVREGSAHVQRIPL